MKKWFNEWFNEDYLKLYSHRNQAEAEKQVDLLFKALMLKGDEKLLDLGCGTGRHALAFAKRGLKVVGIDASSPLIHKAQNLVDDFPNLSLSFICHDIIRLDLHDLFDVAVSLFTSFGYYSEDHENQQILGSARKHLKARGTFVLDYLHPYDVMNQLIPNEEKWIEGKRVKISKHIDNNTVIKTIIFPHRTYQEKIKLYSKETLENMLVSQNFTIREIWDDFERNPWNKQGKRQIFYCEAT